MKSPEIENLSPVNDQTEAKKPTIKWYVYLLLFINGILKESLPKGSFELSDCPTVDDVRMAIQESNIHPPSNKYRIEKRVNGQPKETYFYEKPEISFFQQAAQKTILEVEQDIEDETEVSGQEFILEDEIQSRVEIIVLRRENEQLKRQQAEERAVLEQNRSAQSLPAQNPFDAFFDTLKRTSEMKEQLFGEEIRELGRLRQAASEPTVPTETQSERLAILHYAEKMQNEKLQEKVLGYVFNEEAGGGLLDTAKFVLDNQDAVVSIGQKIIGVLIGNIGGQATMQPNDLEAILKQKPSTNGTNGAHTPLPTPPRSNFKRRSNPATETPPNEAKKAANNSN
jgi:hypothetical protein